MESSEEHAPDIKISQAFARCEEWSILRIERWAGNAQRASDFESGAGYLLALILQAALARKTDILCEVIDKQLPRVMEKLSSKETEAALKIMGQIIQSLAIERDSEVTEEDLDLVISVALKIADSVGNYEDASTLSLLHTVGNVYQSQRRYAELAEIRKRELCFFKPSLERFKDANESLLSLWLVLTDEGRLDDAQACLNDLCEQVSRFVWLGDLALCDLLLDLMSVAFSEEKPERVDLIIDAGLALAQKSFPDATTATIALKMLIRMSEQLEQHQWKHEALRVSKRALILFLDKSPSANELTDLLKKTLLLLRSGAQPVGASDFLSVLHERSQGNEQIPTEFMAILNDHHKKSREEKKILEDLYAKIDKANSQTDPEIRARELIDIVVRAERTHMVHLAPVLHQLTEMYKQSPLTGNQNSVGKRIWSFAETFWLRNPEVVAGFIKEIMPIAAERIRNGALASDFSQALNTIMLHTRASKVAVSFDAICDALLGSEIPDNRLDGLRLQMAALAPEDEPNSRRLYDKVIHIAPEASKIKDGDECGAIGIFLALAGRFRHPRLQMDNAERFKFLINQSLKYFSSCVDAGHTRARMRGLWQFAEQGWTDEHSQKEFVLQLFKACEEKKLEHLVETELDRFLLSAIAHISRSDRLVAEITLSAAIEIRESTSGVNSHRLLPLLRSRLSQLENAKRIPECEKIHIRMAEIASQKPRSEDQAQVDQIDHAIFYVRNDLFHQAAKVWKPILERCTPSSRNSYIGSARRLITLADNCLGKDRFKDAEDIIVRVIQLADEQMFPSIAEIIDKLLTKYEDRGLVDNLEHLYLAIINAPIRPPAASNQYRLKLADLYLSTERVNESRVMYEEAMRVAKMLRFDTKPLLYSRATSLFRHGFKDTGLDLDPKLFLSAGPPCFQFALFGVQEVAMSGNVHVASYNTFCNERPGRSVQSSSAHVGSYGSVSLQGNARVFGSIVQGSPPDPQNSQASQKNVAMINFFERAAKRPALPVPNLADYKFAPVPPIPEGALINNTHRSSKLTSGDYAISDAVWLPAPRAERIRVFLTDDSYSRTPFDLADRHQPTNRPIDFQVWYSGTRDINVGSLCATIYAPCATVRLAGNTNFAGAILANRIICEGNTSVSFDEELFDCEL